MSADVLVIGASSGIGSLVVRQALAAGYRVRGMARSGSKRRVRNDRYEYVRGDARNDSDLARALEDVTVVVQTLGVPSSIKMLTEPVTLFSQSTRALLRQMKRAEVPRLISVTGFGAGTSRANISCWQRIPFEIVLGNAYADKSVQERLIQDSGLDWLIVRPGILTWGERTGRYRVLIEPQKWRNGVISRADVADFIVSQISVGSYSRIAPVLIRSEL